MIPESTYISCLSHRLIRALDADHAVLAATIADMCSHSEDGTKVISLEYLSTILGISKRTLQRQLAKLKLLQVITFDSGLGKGNYGTFQKGANFDTFSGIKGDKTDAFCGDQKVTNFAPKGDKNGTYIDKDIITAAERAGKRATAAEDAAADGDLRNGSPRLGRKEKKMLQEQFEEWWTGFKAKPEYDNRKERCLNVWWLLKPEVREAMLAEVRAGKKHRDNPLHYLQYYTPADVKPEFPIFRNGETSLGDAMKDAENGGRAVACVEAGAKLHMPDPYAYVYLDDALAHGLTVKWTVPRSAMPKEAAAK